MKSKTRLMANSLLAISIALCTFCASDSRADDPVQTQENMLQQASQAGLINKKQMSNLQNQEAQIMQQEVMNKNQNGGNLSPMQRQQLGQAVNNLNQNLNQEIRKNNPNATFQPYQGGNSATGQDRHWHRKWRNNNAWNGNNANSNTNSPNWHDNYPNANHHNSDWRDNNGNSNSNGPNWNNNNVNFPQGQPGQNYAPNGQPIDGNNYRNRGFWNNNN